MEDAVKSKPPLTFFEKAVKALSLSTTVLLRHHFGERYLNVVHYLLGFLVLCIVAYFEIIGVAVYYIVVVGMAASRGGINGVLQSNPIDSVRIAAQIGFLVFFLALYLVVGGLHLINIWLRNLAGERWYSYDVGVSWFSFLIGIKVGPFVVSKWTLYRFVEPLVLVLIGLLFHWRLFFFVGFHFYLLAFLLLLENNQAYSQVRSDMLDLRDAAISNERGRTSYGNTKFHVVRISPFLQHNLSLRLAQTAALARPELVAVTLRKTLRQAEPQISSQQTLALPLSLPMLLEGAAPLPGEGQPEEQHPFDLAASFDSQGPRALQLLSGIWTVGMAVLIVGALLVWLVPNRGAGQVGNAAATAQAGAPVVLPGVGILPGIGGGGRVEPTPIPASLGEVTSIPLHTEEVTVVPQSGRVVQTPVPAGLAAASDVTELPALSVTPAVAAEADGGSQEQTFPAVTLAGNVGQVGLKMAYPGDLTPTVENSNLDSDASSEATAVQFKDASGKVVADFQLLTSGDMVPAGAIQIPGIDFSAALPGSRGAANQTITQVGPDAVEFVDTRGTADRGDDIDIIVFKPGTPIPAFSGPPGTNEETPPGG